MMKVVFQIIEYTATFIEVFIFYRILAGIFKGKRKNNAACLDIIASLIGVVLVSSCNRIALFSYFTIAATGAFMTVSSCMIFEIDAVSAFSMSSFYLLCLNCFDFLMLTLVSSFYGGTDMLEAVITNMGAIRAVIVLLVNILWALIYFALRKYIEKISGNIRGTAFILFTSVVGFVGFVYLADQSRKAFQNTFSIIWFGVVCLLAALIFIGYFKAVNREQKRRLEILEMRNHLLNEGYQAINEIYEGNAKLYHDLSNHLNALYQLMDDGRIDDAKKYIREVSSPIRKLSKKVWTGINVVDAVINSKLHRMDELGIQSEVNVEIPLNGDILASDLCTILSNLLDNAIEASCLCKGDKAPCIILTIRHINHFIIIKIVNPLTKAPEKNVYTGRLQTTKDDKQEHGWGLESVHTAVEKYNGTLEQEWNDQKFETTVLLFC